MKAILAALLTALLLSHPARADPALWEARDADSRIWLFGSVHMLPAGIEWRTQALDDALAASEQVYFETDIGPRGMAAITLKVMVAAFQSASNPWLDLLTDQQLARLMDALEPLGITVEQAGAMAPWLLSMQIAQYQMTAGADTVAGDYAFDSGVEWVLQWELPPERKAFLETPGEQFDMLAQGTLEEQIEQLFALLDQASEGDALDKLIAAWRSGDVETIASTMAPKDEAEEVGTKLLLLDRNRNWMATLERLLAENREDLVVVGAAHLAGEDSVLDLLADAGYTISRIQ
jgi:uncharacterized protein YbaP (TraB family)